MRRIWTVLALIALFAGMTASAAFGSEAPAEGRPARLVMTVDFPTPDPGEPLVGEFRARGAAAAEGIICRTGTVAIGDVVPDGPLCALPFAPVGSRLSLDSALARWRAAKFLGRTPTHVIRRRFVAVQSSRPTQCQ